MKQFGKRINRIALVTDHFTTGGGLNHIFHIARGMNDIEFGVFANGGDGAARFEHVENVVVFDRGYGHREIMDYDPQIVHIHHLKPLLSFHAGPFKRAGIPVLFTVHGIHLHRYECVSGLRSRVEFLLRFNLEKYLYRRVARVITVSEEDRRYVRENHGIDSCIHIPNGIEFETFDRIRLSKLELRRELSLPPGSLLFLTVARFSFDKGYDVLIKALSLARRDISGRDVKFVLVGDGEESETIMAQAREQDVSDLVLFLGRRNDIGSLMKASDVFISPSRWEGLPLTLIEAAYCRLPILCSDTYGNREIVQGGDTGVTFENEDSGQLAVRILEVIDGKHDLETLAARAFAEVKSKYSLAGMTAKLRALYDGFLGVTSGSAG